MNVFPVYRGDKGAIQPIQRLVRKLVRIMLFLPNTRCGALYIRKIKRELMQVLGARHGVLGQTLKQVKKLGIARH